MKPSDRGERHERLEAKLAGKRDSTGDAVDWPGRYAGLS
jgi:hypothetical protein